MVYTTGALNELELSSIDARFHVRGKETPRKDVAVVGLDPQSVSALGISLPPPRRYWAQLIDRIAAAHPKQIVVDVQFLSTKDRREDQQLISSISRARPVLLATHETDNGPVPLFASPSNHGGLTVSAIGASTGSVAVPTDSDGIIRRMLFEPVAIKTLPVTAAELVTGHAVSESHFKDNEAWIDFAGPPGSIPTYSMSNVLSGRTPATALAGKTVLVGITDPAYKDVYETAVSSTPMSGTELQANALSTVLDGFPLSPVSGVVNVLLIVLLAGIPALVGLRWPALYILLAGLATAVLFLLGVQLAFNSGWIVSLTSPLLGLLLSTAGSSAVDFFSETRARRTLQEALDQLVTTVVPGSVVGGFKVEEMVSRGGMGIVYRASQPELDRDVALKVIAPNFAEDETFRERFKREALLAATVEHPNVVPVYEAGEDRGLLFLAMRFIDGRDLRAVLRDEGALSPERVVELTKQVAAALDAAHDVQLVHRDVKPGNVMVTTEGGGEHAYLTDFGLTKHMGTSARMTEEGMFVGTVEYVAPEQIQGKDVDSRADIYSLACVSFELLSGRVPFVRDSEIATLFAHAGSPVPSIRELRPELSAEVDAVFERGMAKQPGDRFAQAGAFAVALASALADAPSRPPAEEPTRSGS